MSEMSNLSDNLIKEEDRCLLEALKAFCTDDYSGLSITSKQWEMIYSASMGHSVASLVNEVAIKNNAVSKEVVKGFQTEAHRTLLANYRFFSMAEKVVRILKEEGIDTAILKGMATASFYRIPELRKSGDIDILLLCREDLDKAERVLKDRGFITDKEQNGSHHLVMNYQNITVELHTSISEDFDNKYINLYQDNMMEEVRKNVVWIDCMGYVIPALSDAYHGYELIIHMLQHFLREGFGLRLLCDWFMFWNREIDSKERELYLKLVKESHIKKFSDIITTIVVEYLGLPEEKISWMNIDRSINSEDYLSDILNSGEFGILENDRMIALKNDSLFEYVRVFHNQMHHNFPKTGKVFIVWPVLWTITYIRFVRNNKKLRNNSGMAYLKKARQRSSLVKELDLFR